MKWTIFHYRRRRLCASFVISFPKETFLIVMPSLILGKHVQFLQSICHRRKQYFVSFRFVCKTISFYDRFRAVPPISQKNTIDQRFFPVISTKHYERSIWVNLYPYLKTILLVSSFSKCHCFISSVLIFAFLLLYRSVQVGIEQKGRRYGRFWWRRCKWSSVMHPVFPSCRH